MYATGLFYRYHGDLDYAAVHFVCTANPQCDGLSVYKIMVMIIIFCEKNYFNYVDLTSFYLKIII